MTQERETIEAAAERLEAMRFTSPVEFTAAKDGEAPKLPTFSIDAYNGGPMNVSAFFYPVVADLTGGKAESDSIPVLLSHREDQLVGQATSVKITAAGVKVDGVITGEDEHANRVKVHAKNGFKWQASIGATVQRREFVEAGKTSAVNGQAVTGPVIIAREWTLYETSFVPLGADRSTSAEVTASAKTTKKENRMEVETPPVEKTPIIAGGLNADDVIKAQRQKLADEAERVDKINTIVAKSGLNYGLNDKGDRVENIAATAIREGMDPRDVQLMVMQAERASQAPAGHIKGGDKNLDTQVIEASLSIAAGVDEKFVAERILTSERERVMNAAVSRENRGFGIHRLMGLVCMLAGNPYTGDHKSDDFIRAAKQAEKRLLASGFSTVSVSGILSNVASKKLLEAYTSVSSVLDKISQAVDASDFKSFKSYRLGMSGELVEVGQDGKLEHVGLVETEFENRVKTRGAIFTLTREMKVNDDLGAFVALPRMMGRKGAISKEKVGFAALLAAMSTFFTAGKGNKLTGAGSVLAIAGLNDAVKAFRERKGPDGELVLANPKYLLACPKLEATAKSLYRETRVNETTTADKPKPADNPHVGMFEPLISPYLGVNGAPTGSTGSDTRWILLADPADVPIMQVAYLRGQRTPIVERDDTDFDTLGEQYRVVFDFGVAMTDDCGGVENAGA